MENALCPSRLIRTCRSALEVFAKGMHPDVVAPTLSAVISSFSVVVVTMVVIMTIHVASA